MPNTLQTKEITSLGEFTTFIEGSLKPGELKWYRGCGKESHKLLPTLYRRSDLEASQMLDIEYEILERFMQRSLPFINRPITFNSAQQSWEYLFIMQHWGVPTRLLDWTENPYTALYFALNSAESTIDTTTGDRTYKENVALWMLDPKQWNKTSLHDISGTSILSTFQEEYTLSGFAPREPGSKKAPRVSPAAMYGTHNSSRIVAQKGVFVIFGSSPIPMEDLYISDTKYPSDCLIKLIIPIRYINTLKETLSRIGITDSVVFPDLEGLAREIKRSYSY